MRHIIYTLLLLTLGFAHAADPLPTARKLGGVGWEGRVGVPGGIPERTTIFTTVAAGSSVATVQAAINSCPDGQVVLLAPGFYSWSTQLLGKSNITLRGSGSGMCAKSPTSLVVGTGTRIWTTQNKVHFQAGQTVRAWDRLDAANYMQGTVTSLVGQVLTVNVTSSGGSGTVSDWIIGNMAWTLINSTNYPTAIQTGDTTWYDEWINPNPARHVNWTAGYTQGSTSITLASTSGISTGDFIILDQFNDADADPTSAANPAGPYLSGEYTSVTYPNVGRDRIQWQLNRVANVAGNVVTLEEPLYMPNWSSGQTPQAWYFNTHPALTEYWGIENMCLAVPAGDRKVIEMVYAYGCWVKNCFVTGPNDHESYIGPVITLRCEIRHNNFLGPGSLDDYGVRPFLTSGLLMIDNVGDNCGTFMMLVSVNGSVFAYNYAVNLQSQNGYQTAGMYTHGGFPHMNLLEGNYVPQMALNCQWQNSAYMTGFRNRLTAVSDGSFTVNGNIQAVEDAWKNRHASVLGSVLGTTGVLTRYQDTPLDSGPGTNRVYSIGGNAQNDLTGAPYDPDTLSTLLRVVNWDSAHGAIYEDGPYTIADLPNSYFSSTKPAFVGSLTWPAFDPASPTRTYTVLPAGWRWSTGNEDYLNGAGNGDGIVVGTTTVTTTLTLP